MRPWRETSMHDFSFLGGTAYGFNKKRGVTRYTDLVFSHPVGSAGHIVHSGASWARYVDALFFMLRWDQYRFHKKHIRTRYAECVFLHPVGSAVHVVHSVHWGTKRRRTIFHVWVG
jgi:hypothetical protein